MTPIVIYPKRSRVFFVLLISIVILAISARLLTLPQEISIKGTIAAWLCVPIFGSSALFALSRLFSNKPAITIDNAGITDNASALSVGFIPWSDITGVRIGTVKRQKFLGLLLRNPEKYLAKASLLKRLLMKSNLSWGGYAVTIPQVALSLSVEDLLLHVMRVKKMSRETSNA